MIKKVLVPLDGSKLAERALPYAEELAEKFEAKLFLVRVLQPLMIVSDYGANFYEQQMEHEEREAKIYLKSIQGELRELNFPAETYILSGQPIAETIIEMACEHSIDLIVMSTHGRSGLGRWIYGSVASKVLQHAPCPIYLVRATELSN